ncbi:MAG: hypothetical protein KDA29_14720 [Phycisphaerales bacterium]|nr:hypothetical protein [Phycisphaerales bacterium]
MSDNQMDQIEKLLLQAKKNIAPKVDAMFLVVSRYPEHDDGIGRVQFIRFGRGPAFQLALKTLVTEIEFVEVDEIDGDADSADEV